MEIETVRGDRGGRGREGEGKREIGKERKKERREAGKEREKWGRETEREREGEKEG